MPIKIGKYSVDGTLSRDRLGLVIETEHPPAEDRTEGNPLRPGLAGRPCLVLIVSVVDGRVVLLGGA